MIEIEDTSAKKLIDLLVCKQCFWLRMVVVFGAYEHGVRYYIEESEKLILLLLTLLD